MAAVAVLAQNEPDPATALAGASVRRRDPIHVLLKLAGLVELSNLVGSTDVPAADEDLGKAELPPAKDPLQLREESHIHRQIPLVNCDAEAAEDGSDGAAVLKSLADHPKRGEVEHDLLLLPGGEATGFRGRGRQEGGARRPDSVEDRGRLRDGGGGGAGAEPLINEGMDVFERGYGGRARKGMLGGGGFAANSTPRQPHRGFVGEGMIGRQRERERERESESGSVRERDRIGGGEGVGRKEGRGGSEIACKAKVSPFSLNLSKFIITKCSLALCRSKPSRLRS